MDKENLNAGTPEQDEETMLPEGYEDENIFDEPDGDDENIFGKEDTIEGFGSEGNGAEDPAPKNQPETEKPEKEDGVGEDSGSSASAAEQGQEVAPPAEKLLQIKKGDTEVSVKESDLPDIYQKAQDHDRVSGQLHQLQQSMDRINAIANGMGFASAQEMLDKATESYRDAEVKRLVDEGMHEEAARDLVERKMQATKPQSVQQTQQAAPSRDFRREIAELVQQRPDLREQLANGGKLPHDVITACVKDGLPLRIAYAEHEAREVKAEAERIRQENEILKQNAANATKAPVKSVTAGGSTDTKGKDPFIVGFESDN